MSDLFTTNGNPHKLCRSKNLYSSNKRTVKFGINNIGYMGPQIWTLLHLAPLFEIFQPEAKKWKHVHVGHGKPSGTDVETKNSPPYAFFVHRVEMKILEKRTLKVSGMVEIY